MRTARLLLPTLAILAAFARAGDDDLETLADRLFHDDAAVRAEARERLAAAGEKALPALLRAIETRRGGTPVLRIYDIRDLAGDEVVRGAAEARIESVEGGEATFDAERGTLVVRAPEAVQERIEKELRALRAEMGRLVRFEMRCVRLGTRAEEAPASLQADEVEGFLAKHQAETLAAPRLVTRNGQEASISVLRQISYVSDFEVKGRPGAAIADPVVATAEEGLSLNLRPVIDGEAIRVVLSARFAELESPMPTVKLPLPLAGAVEVQVPVGRTTTVTRLVRCEPGRIAVVDLGDGRRLLLDAAEVEAPGPASPR